MAANNPTSSMATGMSIMTQASNLKRFIAVFGLSAAHRAVPQKKPQPISSDDTLQSCGIRTEPASCQPTWLPGRRGPGRLERRSSGLPRRPLRHSQG